MDRRKYGSTTGNPNNVSGPKISGLPSELSALRAISDPPGCISSASRCVRYQYNYVRPHSSLDYLTPVVFAEQAA